MKRILAMIMSLAMLLSATELSFSVNAAENSESAVITESGAEMASVSSVSSTATTYFNSIMEKTNDGTYGRQFNTHESGWYTSLEYIETVVRLVYAEAPWWLADKQATSWVLWNRRQSTESRFLAVNTLYDVAVQPGEFTSITGESNATGTARKPDVTIPSWRNSANYVSMIWAAAIVGGDATPSGLLPVPTGYTGQLDFRGYSSFFVENPTYTQNYAFTRNGVPYYHMYNSKTGTASEARIYHICIPGVGVYESIEEAKEKYYTKYDNIAGEKVNIYFSWNNY